MLDQDRVATFVDRHGLEAPPAYRLLDLTSEVGELAKDAAESTDYGSKPERIDVAEDEIGDVLFSTLALAESLGVDANDALDVALAKYEERMETGDDPSSGT